MLYSGNSPSAPRFATAPPRRASAVHALGMLACLAVLLASAACDSNPTDVGGGLIGQQDVAPERVVLPLDVDTVQYAPVTGAASGPALSASRVLAGQTTGDPLGDTQATGYVDFFRTSLPANAATRSVDTVEVRLKPNYFYGDTTQAVTLSLHDLREEWELGRGRADTSLTGLAEPSEITTFSVEPSDTLVTVDLPGRWVRAHLNQLRASDDSVFAQNFHGFQIRPESGNAVVGFASAATSIRASFESGASDETTSDATFQLSRQLSTIRQPTPSVPQGSDERYVLQNGTGRILTFDFKDLPDSLRNASVNKATLILETDTTRQTGSFVRPRFESLQLYATPDTEQTARALSGAYLAFDAEENRFEDQFSPQTTSLTTHVQNVLLNASDIDHFEVRPQLKVVRTSFGGVPVHVPSLNSTLIRHDAGHAPRLVVVYTPTGE